MKKLTLILGIAAIGLVACNKESKEITADTAENTVILEDSARDMNANAVSPEMAPLPPAAPVAPEENLVADAKKNPVTTLVLTESNYDFKDVKKGAVVDHKFEFTNTGKNPLIISAVKPGCGCTVPEYTKEPIMPGKKGFVNLKFDSSSFDGMQNKSADVYANVENMPIKLSFSANVVK